MMQNLPVIGILVASGLEESHIWASETKDSVTFPKTLSCSFFISFFKIFISAAIPVSEAEQNDNIAIVVTSHGGHIGFLEGLYPRHRGYMDRLFAQFVDAIFKHGSADLKKD